MIGARHVILAAAPLLLGGCGGSGGLTTASLIGGGEPAQAAPAPAGPAPSDPTSRALQVGATSARAGHCGFFFDPAKLKASFLAAESAKGASPEQLQKVEREYDYVRASVAKKIAGEADYCSDPKAREIKSDLARHLAGDFTPPVKKEAAEDSLFSGLMDGGNSATPFEPGKIWDQNNRVSRTR